MCLWCWERANWITLETGSSIFINYLEKQWGLRNADTLFLTDCDFVEGSRGREQANKQAEKGLSGRKGWRVKKKHKTMNQPCRNAAKQQQRNVGNTKWQRTQPQTWINSGVWLSAKNQSVSLSSSQPGSMGSDCPCWNSCFSLAVTPPCSALHNGGAHVCLWLQHHGDPNGKFIKCWYS